MEKIFSTILEKNPTLGLIMLTFVIFGSVIAGVIITIIKMPVRKSEVDEKYYADIREKTADMKEFSKEINRGNEILESMCCKIDQNTQQQEKSFNQLLAKSEKQNEVLTEIAEQTKMHTQFLISLMNKK